MPKAQPIEAKVASLKQDALAAELKAALADRSNLMVAKAAGIVEHRKLLELSAALEAAFVRFLPDGAKSDKGCIAKGAIVRALDCIESRSTDIFLAGVRCYQHEPSWGGPSDTAGELRGISAMALVRINYQRSLIEIAPLLIDKQPGVRAAGARAVAAWDTDEAEAILRLRVLMHDEDPTVMAECLTSLAKNFPLSITFVATFLDDKSQRDIAAVALGESRRPEAFDVLKMFWEASIDEESRRIALIGLALLRSESAVQFILDAIEKSNAKLASLALKSLSAYRHDTKLRDRIQQIVNDRDDSLINEAMKETF